MVMQSSLHLSMVCTAMVHRCPVVAEMRRKDSLVPKSGSKAAKATPSLPLCQQGDGGFGGAAILL